jgi:hypothetical protein
MAYSINPNLPRARALAIKLLLQEKLPLQVVANKCGVHRSTIYRWKLKWLKLNEHQQLENFNRPSRQSRHNSFRLMSCSWLIATLSSRPKHSPKAIPENIVELVISLRQMLKRCAEVVWFHLVNDNGVNISLSSVRRILRRHHYINGRKKRVRPSNPIRPIVTKPGELVQTDTVHYVDPLTKHRRYVYTVIDLYSRMTYAEDTLARHNILTRHSRLHRPNDNAHIERFNRTIQEECLGRYLDFTINNQRLQVKINRYLEFYNNKRVHLSLQYRTPNQMLQSS